MRIALCDDDPQDLARMVRLLEEVRAARRAAPTAESGIGRAGAPRTPRAEIVAFDRPEALLEAARAAPFDLYLLDVVMDALSGIQLVSKLRHLQREPQVIFFSTSREYAYDAFQVKAVTYVAKPYTREQFEAALNEALGRLAQDAAHYLLLGKGGQLRRFRADAIEYGAPGDTANYVRLHLEDGTTVETRYGFAAFAQDHEKLVKLVPLGRALLVNPAQVMNLADTHVTFFSGRALDIPRRALHTLRDAILACSTGDKAPGYCTDGQVTPLMSTILK